MQQANPYPPSGQPLYQPQPPGGNYHPQAGGPGGLQMHRGGPQTPYPVYPPPQTSQPSGYPPYPVAGGHQQPYPPPASSGGQPVYPSAAGGVATQNNVGGATGGTITQEHIKVYISQLFLCINYIFPN